MRVPAGMRRADRVVHLGDVVGRRRQAGADRPDRLVGDDQPRGVGAVGQRAGELRRDDVDARGRPRARRGSRRRRRSRRARRATPPRSWPARRRRSRRSRGAARNGRRSTWLHPASFSISALTQPVKAPDGCGWQSWPPSATPLPASASPTAASSVNGGHTSRSQRCDGRRGPLGDRARQRHAVGAQPFIFQLPATSRFRSGISILRCGAAPQRGEVAAAAARCLCSLATITPGFGAGQPTARQPQSRRSERLAP